MFARISIGLVFLAVATLLVAAPGNDPGKVEKSPHAAALELVFSTEKARIRELDAGNWWHDVEERTWIVKRPFMPGTIDSTHLFHVSYRIDGKEVASWLVDTAQGDVRPAKTGRGKAE